MTARQGGAVMFAAIVLILAAAPVLSPNDPARQFAGHAYAPPMRPRVLDDGQLRRPFVYPVTVVDRLERRFEEDRARPASLPFLTGGRLWASPPGQPWLPLGGDPLGRDVLARLLSGGRLSLGVALVATVLALALGGVLGAAAGFAGGRIDRIITAVADFTIVLPLLYVVVTLRAVMPLTLEPATVFWTLAAVMALASWPVPARGVRAVIATEKQKEYAEAAYAAGASPLRILLRHLLPAAAGQLATHGILLFPAFIFAEATLSFVGLGFAEPVPSWGLMLHDAARVSVMFEAPWLLSPAAAIVVTVLAARMVFAGGDRTAAVPP
jgi:peptide/nickel transport system permease protein